MCGIAGIISPRISPADREQAVARMVARQRHRGPDDEGLFSHGDATIGMCRLAIFDPANGRQPMSTPDGRLHIVFNGAIYNHRELRSELESCGRPFRTNCDTEVLLASYAQWGEGCLPRLRGMFAFCVLDSRERTAFLARGPLGIKPLYYARLPGDTFVFGSELNAILASRVVDRGIDPVAVGDYLAWFAVPAPRTIYRGISNLPPGHKIRIDADGRFHSSCWWQLPGAKPEAERARGAKSYGDFIRELRGRLEDTIRAHQAADVPVGAFLSGGVDSSAIVALMAARGGPRIKTFSLAFEEREFSEGPAARATADALGTDHHEEVLTGRRVAADLPRIIESLDQPTGDGVNTYYISKAARRGGVTVALSGLGGDEMFGGYPSFKDAPQAARLLPYWLAVPRRVRGLAVGALQRRGVRARKLTDVLTHARDLHEVCSLRRRVLSEPTRLALLAPEARQLALRQGPHHPGLDNLVLQLTGADSFQVTSAWEMRTYMADVLLRDSDVCSMSHSLELRVPFVDRALVEWWWNQPQAHKFDPRRPKAALIDAVANVIPAEAWRRPKRGFALPFPRWMGGELKPFLDETFSAASLSRCPWLDAFSATAEYAHFRRRQDSGRWIRVWTLAILIALANRP